MQEMGSEIGVEMSTEIIWKCITKKDNQYKRNMISGKSDDDLEANICKNIAL